MIKPFQGELKSLSKEDYLKLKNEIINNGFCMPLHLWYDTEAKDYKLLDGHQRFRVLGKMMEEGYKVPERLPCQVLLEATREQAKGILLAFCSQYGKMTNESLFEYLFDSGIDPSEYIDRFSIDAIDDKHFFDEYFSDEIPEEKETCPACGKSVQTKKKGR